MPPAGKTGERASGGQTLPSATKNPFEKRFLELHFLSIRKEVTQIFACKFLQKAFINGNYIGVCDFE